MPAIITAFGLGSAAATPTIRDETETIPSFAPRTAARSQPLRVMKWGSPGWADGPGIQYPFLCQSNTSFFRDIPESTDCFAGGTSGPITERERLIYSLDKTLIEHIFALLRRKRLTCCARAQSRLFNTLLEHHTDHDMTRETVDTKQSQAHEDTSSTAHSLQIAIRVSQPRDGKADHPGLHSNNCRTDHTRYKS